MFIKNKEDIANPQVRASYGSLSGIVGIICNIILFAIKFLAGYITSSISITADALNNLSDAGSSIMTLVGFKMAGKPADPDHPYGHGRIEYIAGLLISVVILLMGFELFKSSLKKIISPEEIEFSIISVVILIFSIALKLWMALFNNKLGKKLESSAMLATSTDSRNDSIATTAVLIGVLIFRFCNVNVDGYIGLLVALFVLWSGFTTANDTIRPLLGEAPDPAFVKALEQEIMSHEGIIGIHDLIVHNYGPGRVIVSTHAEIPYDMNVMMAHDIIDTAEQDIKAKFNCNISIHMDPIMTDDAQTNDLKEKTTNIILKIDDALSLHDFRITTGPLRTNLIFDVVVPFNFKYTDKELIDLITTEIKKLDSSYYAVIEIDKKMY